MPIRKILPLAFLVSYAAYSLLVLYSRYLSGDFVYHDFTFISEYMSSTAYGKGPMDFWVSDAKVSHARIHLTPTFYLLVPFFRFFDSQFVLMVITVALFALSSFIFLKLAEVLKENFANHAPFPALSWSLALLSLFLLTRYPKNVLLSCNIWFLYLFFAGLTGFTFVRGNKILPWVFALLALGVREDTGIYLAAQMLILAFVTNSKNRKHALALSLFSLFYTALFVLYIGPKYGFDAHIGRGWSHYGNSWPEILWTALTSPLRVLKEIFHSAFPKLNLSFYLLPLLHPVSFVLANGPATLLYLSSDASKKFLWYYTAGFVLPGIYIATILGTFTLLKLTRHAKWIFIGIVLTQLLTIKDTDGYKFIPKFQFEKTAPVRMAMEKLLIECPKIKSVASDFHNLVFLPNYLDKRFLDSFQEADAVVFTKKLAPGLPGQKFSHPEQLAKVAGSGFVPREFHPEVTVFVRQPALCDRP